MTCILGARENIPGFFLPKVIIFFKKSTNLMLITRPFTLYWVFMSHEVPSTVFAPGPLVV